MTIDVVIPCRNRSTLLGEALASVAIQDVSDLRVFIVDDFSETPITVEDVQRDDLNVSIVRNDRVLGIAGSRNRGAQLGRAPYLAFLDSDDLWIPGAIGSLLTTALDNDSDLAFGMVEQFLDGAPPEASERYHEGPILVPLAGSCLFRRESFHSLGGFSESLEMAEFIDLISRARSAHWVITELPIPVLRRRIHSGNYSRLSRQASGGYLDVVRRHMGRRS